MPPCLGHRSLEVLSSPDEHTDRKGKAIMWTPVEIVRIARVIGMNPWIPTEQLTEMFETGENLLTRE